MAIDPSIPLQIGQGVAAPPNMLDTFGKYQGVANAMALNKSIQANTAQTQQGTAQSGQTYAAKQVAALAALPDGMRGQGAAFQLVQHLDDMQLMPPGMKDVWNQRIAGAPGQAGLDHLYKTILIGNMDPSASAETMYGKPGLMDIGSGVQPIITRSGAMGGGVQPVGNMIGLGLTPAQQAQQVEQPANAAQSAALGVPEGTPISVTLAQRLVDQGMRHLLTGGGATPQTGNTLPDKLRKPAPTTVVTPAPVSATPAIAPPTTGGPVPVGFAPGQVTELESSAKNAGFARQRANSYQERIQPVEGALKALSGADTGKAAETLNSLRANIQDIAPDFLQKMLPSSLSDPAKREAYEQANKYLAGMIATSPGGTRSDAGSASAAAAMPNTRISNAAATQVAQVILAHHRLEQSGTMAFNKSGLPASGYDRFMSQWNTAADPRAFIHDKLTYQERINLAKSMGGVNTSEYEKYRQSVLSGVNAGIIPKDR